MQNERSVIAVLAERYPQLYLDPDKDETGAYQEIVRQGRVPEEKNLTQYTQDPGDRMETMDTPAGPAEIVLLRERSDFEIFIRNMMAAKNGPREPVPPTQGAATLVAFNWGKIHGHRKAFLLSEALRGNQAPDWNAEFRRFTADKSNYQDLLVVLSDGPYSAVSAEAVGLSEEEWKEKSYLIRKYHECTHVICRKLYPGQTDAVYDELAADAIGIYAAFGRFDPEMEKMFLGIEGDAYVGGRLENYTDDCNAAEINRTLDVFEQLFSEHAGVRPFDMIPVLYEKQCHTEKNPLF